MSKTAFRSISYTPDSPVLSSALQPEWTLCRNQSVYPVPDNATLERWTEQGRVRSDDYLVNQPLDVCVQARDVAEIDAIFRKAKARLLGRIWRALACGALGLMWVQPLFGTLILISAGAAAMVAVRVAHPRRDYQLSTRGGDSCDRRSEGPVRVLTVRAA